MTSPHPPHTTSHIGRYEVIGELGKGAMGLVLLARDPILEREVALKFLRPDLKLSADDRLALMTRMRQEARAIARVTHPGIVSLHDIGEDPGRGVFLVFERADGPTIEAALRRGRLTKEGVARLGRELGEALTSAHVRDIVHRDIKPGNIILTEEGAKVTDFGVARLPDSTLTKAGAKVGTPAYSAPEAVLRGEHSPLSDQFSLAATLYEALSGRRAFPGDDAVTVARSIEHDKPFPIARSLGLPERVDEVFARGMAKKAAERFPTCAAFGIGLSAALIGTREIQPTLPDQRALLAAGHRSRNHAVGAAVLWLLVGASLGVLVAKALPAASPGSTRTFEDDAQTTEPNPHPAPAYISPLPASAR